MAVNSSASLPSRRRQICLFDDDPLMLRALMRWKVASLTSERLVDEYRYDGRVPEQQVEHHQAAERFAVESLSAFIHLVTRPEGVQCACCSRGLSRKV